MPVAVIGQFRLPPERMAEARAAMARVVTATRAEDGCLAYSYAEDMLDPGLIRVSELWASRAHLAAHFTAPHMARWQEERAALGMTERVVTAYELGAAETL
ncbi:MAG: putative quinol monooxygenase [Novosphingobium sp.]